jgi:hypothetical protein
MATKPKPKIALSVIEVFPVVECSKCKSIVRAILHDGQNLYHHPYNSSCPLSDKYFAPLPILCEEYSGVESLSTQTKKATTA